MTMEENKGWLKNILELRFIIENTFFKAYEESSDYPMNLNHTHVKTMIILNFEGEQPMSVVSHKLNLEKGSFTPVANHLIELGYIEKVLDPRDKRVYNLRLLEKGKTLTKEVIANHNAFVNKRMEHLKEDEKKRYFDAIELIIGLTAQMQQNKKMLQTGGTGKPFHMS